MISAPIPTAARASTHADDKADQLAKQARALTLAPVSAEEAADIEEQMQQRWDKSFGKRRSNAAKPRASAPLAALPEPKTAKSAAPQLPELTKPFAGALQHQPDPTRPPCSRRTTNTSLEKADDDSSTDASTLSSRKTAGRVKGKGLLGRLFKRG